MKNFKTILLFISCSFALASSDAQDYELARGKPAIDRVLTAG